MSIMDDILLRNKKGSAKEEDYAVLYNDHSTVAHRGDYRGVIYAIFSGEFPSLMIEKPNCPLNGLQEKVTLTDRNGMEHSLKQVDSGTRTTFVRYYNEEGEYTTGKKEGTKYTVDEIDADAKAFIDGVIELENDYIKFSVKDKN